MKIYQISLLKNINNKEDSESQCDFFEIVVRIPAVRSWQRLRAYDEGGKDCNGRSSCASRVRNAIVIPTDSTGECF